MSLFTASYMSNKHCVRPEGAWNLLHFENTPNTSLQTRWKICICKSDLWEKSCALVTMAGSGFLNFKFLVMFVFIPWHFLIARRTAGVLSSQLFITPPHLWSTTGKMSHQMPKPEPVPHPSKSLISHTDHIHSKHNSQPQSEAGQMHFLWHKQPEVLPHCLFQTAPAHLFTLP